MASRESYVSVPEEISLDSIYVKIGTFGKYQKILYILMAIPMFCNAVFQFGYAFTASPVNYRCKTECDNEETPNFMGPWLNFTTPLNSNGRGDYSKCERFGYVENTTATPAVCSRDNFDSTNLQDCNNKYVFKDNEITIANEFNIFCSKEWMLSMVGTISSFAQFIGYPIGGFLSDRYGRKTVIAVSGSISAFMGLIKSFAPNYIVFVIFEFLDAIAGNTLFGSVFVMAIELAVPDNRVLSVSILATIYPFGEIFLAYVASYTQNWRWLLRIAYLPALIHLIYLWVLPESIRWQLSQGKEEDVKKSLKRAAKMNNADYGDLEVNLLLKENCNTVAASQVLVTSEEFPVRDAFRILPMRIFVCSICFLTCALVFNGLNLNAVLLGGNKYNNFMMIAMAEVPGSLLPIFIMDRFGRRFSISSCMVLSGISIALTVFVDKGNHLAVLILFLLGKCAITASFQILMFYSSELFPTTVRHSLIAFCSTIGRIGSLLAPQTTLLAKYFASGPSIIFSTLALLVAILSLKLPETNHSPLPRTLEEARNIGKNKPNDLKELKTFKS